MHKQAGSRTAQALCGRSTAWFESAGEAPLIITFFFSFPPLLFSAPPSHIDADLEFAFQSRSVPPLSLSLFVCCSILPSSFLTGAVPNVILHPERLSTKGVGGVGGWRWGSRALIPLMPLQANFSSLFCDLSHSRLSAAGFSSPSARSPAVSSSPLCLCPSSPLYRLLGQSITVSVRLFSALLKLYIKADPYSLRLW